MLHENQEKIKQQIQVRQHIATNVIIKFCQMLKFCCCTCGFSKKKTKSIARKDYGNQQMSLTSTSLELTLPWAFTYEMLNRNDKVWVSWSTFECFYDHLDIFVMRFPITMYGFRDIDCSQRCKCKVQDRSIGNQCCPFRWQPCGHPHSPRNLFVRLQYHLHYCLHFSLVSLNRARFGF